MKIAKLDILANETLSQADAVCFTSNGMVEKNGKNVMGGGIAKQFNDRFPGLDHHTGTLIGSKGLVCQVVHSVYIGPRQLSIVSFPTNILELIQLPFDYAYRYRKSS